MFAAQEVGVLLHFVCGCGLRARRFPVCRRFVCGCGLQARRFPVCRRNLRVRCAFGASVVRGGSGDSPTHFGGH